MAKKSNNDVPNPNSVSNRDILQRLNFLYQASVYLNNIAPPSNSKPKGNRRTRSLSVSDLSRSYIDTMKTVGTRTTVKMDPSVKRTLCKGCNVVLLPGSTASIRVKKSPSHRHVISYTCTTCNMTRRIPAPPTLDHTSSEPLTHPEAQAEAEREDLTMDSESGALERPASKGHRPRQKRLRHTPRPPPLFARDAGHVVFCGNEQLAHNHSEGSGVYVI